MSRFFQKVIFNKQVTSFLAEKLKFDYVARISCEKIGCYQKSKKMQNDIFVVVEIT